MHCLHNAEIETAANLKQIMMNRMELRALVQKAGESNACEQKSGR